MELGYRHYAGLKGSKVKRVGADASVYQYTDLAVAFTASQPNDTIILEDGTYTLSSAVTVAQNITVVGVGNVTITGAVADRLFMFNKPAFGTSETKITFINLQLTNTTASADVVEIDNDAGGTGALTVKFLDCGFTSNSGLALDVDQTTATEDMAVYVFGNKSLPFDSCNLAISKAASKVFVKNYDLTGGQAFALGTDDVASVYLLDDCIYSSTALTTGGAASVEFTATNCVKSIAGVSSVPLIGDFDHTGNKYIFTQGALAS